ncbi:Putative white-brown complex homolog protein 30 [Seminavis robusta]|uniref:White-brown complex homolog protein 30 n=1 Tax=Seminavis robusta TaxID=568900 RepID=A0A9N8EE04_9STRA|nr:Putative white-brown complex homolog protein 30 [Seminavis robusta]|eukprot:Sro1014_g231420.1 Putative white-brown complex homolog protein 30 (630) ;mRNA; f:15960-18930
MSSKRSETAALVKKQRSNAGSNASKGYSRRTASSGMEQSVFRFKDVNFVVGSGKKQRNLLSDITGKVRYGHVLAVMGPSGAGKTTLISALTLDAFYGKPSGKVTLNGVKLTDSVFKQHCYVMKQHDKHWPYLTCRETLQYAAELYNVSAKKDIPLVVEEIIQKMGLSVCSETRCARLSGGQQRRLSIGVALLKQPTLLFLDEPTSGLDAAAAENIMQEIVRVAKEERLIIMCSIHQPSTKVYNGFDEVMILSKGREAFSGPIKTAPTYFDSIGYPIPEQMNPAEHFLDLVNSDFSSPEEVDRILNEWEETNPNRAGSVHGTDNDDDGQKGIAAGLHRNPCTDMMIMFRRHARLIVRDPVLYVGRCIIILVTNVVFGFVYWSARVQEQAQAPNKHFINIWFAGVATNMGVVAVYALNDEFKSILRESKNGMVSPMSYVIAKSVMVLPVIYLTSLFALIIPGFVIQQFPWSSIVPGTLLWSALFFCFENLAECLAVWIDDPIIGMLQFMNFWFMCFLFSGNFLNSEIMYWPFELFYHILPFSYYLRSATYTYLHDIEWDKCVGGPSAGQPICVPSGDPTEVLNSMTFIYSVVDAEDHYLRDIIVILGIAGVFKIVYLIGVFYKTRRVAAIK